MTTRGRLWSNPEMLRNSSLCCLCFAFGALPGPPTRVYEMTVLQIVCLCCLNELLGGFGRITADLIMNIQIKLCFMYKDANLVYISTSIPNEAVNLNLWHAWALLLIKLLFICYQVRTPLMEPIYSSVFTALILNWAKSFKLIYAHTRLNRYFCTYK